MRHDAVNKIKKTISVFMSIIILGSNLSVYAEEMTELSTEQVTEMQTEQETVQAVVQPENIPEQEPSPTDVSPSENQDAVPSSSEPAVELPVEDVSQTLDALSYDDDKISVLVKKQDGSFDAASVLHFDDLNSINKDATEKEKEEYYDSLLVNESVIYLKENHLNEADYEQWMDAFTDVNLFSFFVTDESGNQINDTFDYFITFKNKDLFEKVKDEKIDLIVIGHNDEKDYVYSYNETFILANKENKTVEIDFAGKYDYYTVLYMDAEYKPDETESETEAMEVSSEDMTDEISDISDELEEYIEVETEIPLAANTTAFVFEDKLNVYETASTESNIIAELEKGVEVTVLRKRSDGWVYVTTTVDGQVIEGYVDSAYLTDFYTPDEEIEIVTERESETEAVTETEINTEAITETETETELIVETEMVEDSRSLKAPATDMDNKYVFLYENGDLVFQQGNETSDSKGEIVYQAVAYDGNKFDKNWDKTLVKRVYFDTTVRFNGGVGSLFYWYSNLEYVYNINNLDIDGGITLGSAFEDCSKLKHISGLADWDVTGVKSISYLFENCGVLDNINDIESWNLTLNSSGLGYAFYGCKFLQTIDLSGWDLSNITSLSATFSYSSNLESINLGNIFSNVTSDISLSDTFMYCYSLRDIGGLFDNASNAYLYRAFYDCRNLEGPIDFSGMNIRSLYYTFYECYKLKGIDFTGCSFRSINMEGAFDYCYDLRYVDFTDITSSSSFGTMNYTFKSTKKLPYLDLSHSSFQRGGTDTFYTSGISKIKLGVNWKFGESVLPSGNWRRESTDEIFTADELKQQWNSTMADTYEKVNVITFDGNGGTVSKSKFIKQLDEVMTEDDFPTAARDGYSFAGWFTDKDGGEPFDVGSPVTQSVYYAHWNENSYTLVLKRNVDDDPNDTESRVSLNYSEVYQLQPDLFTNEDKVIQGWTTNPDGSGTFYSADEKIIGLTGVDDGEFYLYAKWGRTHNATISFDSQGGDDVADIVRERGQTLYQNEYVIPKKEGYSFLGWFTAPEGGLRWDTQDRIIMGSQQLYAHWVKNPIISFVPNGGWISTFSREVPYGGHLDSLPWGEDRIKKLMGFYTEQEQGQGVKLTTSKTFTEDATYYAHWGYQPTFNTAGGKYVSAFNVNTIYPISENNMLTITSLPEVTYDGYTLVRWKLGDGTTVNVGDTIDLSRYPEIIAEWAHTNTVKVTFDPNGGRLDQYYQSYSVLPSVYEMEKDTALSYYPSAYKYVSNKKFDFMGWYDENDVLYTRDSIISEDITLYAKYKADSNIKYIFKVKDNNFRATGDSYNTSGGYRVTYVYKNAGDELGEIPGLESPTGKKLNGIYLDGWYSIEPEQGYAVNDIEFVDGIPNIDGVTADTYVPFEYLEDGYERIQGNSLIVGYVGEWVDVPAESVSEYSSYGKGHIVIPSGDTTEYILGENEGTRRMFRIDDVVYSNNYTETYDDNPFEVDGVTLKQGAVKLTSDTVRDADSTWYARIIDNKVDKFNDIISYKYYAEWVNASNQDVSNVDNNLSFHPQSYNEQVASLHLHFELDDAVSTNLPVGAVRIKIPKYIWKDWNGNDIGTVNLSAQIPQYPSIQSGMQFSYAEDDDYYIILNNQTISGGAGVDVTLSYTVDPLKVPGGAVDKNKDYVDGYDYYTGDVPVLFEVDRDIVTTYEETTVSGKKVVTLTDDFEADTSESLDLSVEMHTFVEPGISKSYQKIYYQWQNDWGTAPDDADDYFYLYWQTQVVSKNNQPYTYTISEDTVHDGTVIYGVSSGPYNRNSGSTYNWDYLYTVTKHPKSLLDPIPSTGLKITNQSRYNVVQKSGYTQEVVAEATYTMYKWEYTKGEFDKTNCPGVRNNYGYHGFKSQSSSVQTSSGGQDKILGNQDLTLEWELHYDGVSRDTPIEWDEESQTYRRDQRVISFTDGINNDFMYSSGEPYSKYVWEPSTGNYVLSDRDYTITKLRIFVNEYDGSYHNGEWGGPTLRSDYGLWKDIDIYLRYKDTDELVFWKSVRPWATGKYYVGTSNQYGYTDVTLPNNVVGWEIRYPTKYYSTYLQVNELVTLHATADVKSYIMSDVAKGVYSEIKNRAYCNIWTSDNEMEDPDSWNIRYYLSNFTEDTWEEPDIFFHVTNWKGGLNSANKEIWELTKSQSSMYARKYAAGHDRVLFDVERGVQDDPMAIIGWNYNNSTFTPIKTGRFYDLLPKGATVDKSTIFGVLGSNNSTSYSSNVANDYISARDNTSNHLGKEYYNVEFVENWEDSGRTMMIIDYTAPTNSTNCAIFYYLLHMTYQDVVSYGTSVRNDVAFIDTTKDNVYSYASAVQSTLEEDAYLYDTINITNDYVSYSAANTDYIPVDAFSWGFYKSVKTQNGYVSSDITIPNNLYTYKINYSQSDYAVSNSIVFFDVLEAGGFKLVKDEETGQPIPDPITGENVYRKIKDSAWTGTFESIDVDAITNIAKEGTTDVFCKPVIYYSTKPKDSFTGSDYNVNKTETWSTEMPANKADITAIAVDCTKATDGSDFSMFGRQSVPIYITMRAPTDEEYIGTTAVNQAMFFGRINNDDSSSSSDTEVTLTEEEPEIHKTSDPETGTLEAPTIISSGDDLTYTITVTNKNEDFTVPDFVVEDTVPDGVQVDTANISVHFGDAANTLPISISPRASLVVRGTKLVFTINSLSPEETCYLIIPCKAKASGGQVLINTSKITKVNGVDKEIDSETTYHKVEFDIIFSKQSDQHKLVIGSTLQLWDTDANEMVEEWVTGTANKKIRLHTGHYVLKEIDVPDGYAIADDIVFEIQDDGTVKFEDDSVDTKVVMIDVASTSVRGEKTWKFDEESDRPSSITVKLMRKTENDAEPVYSGKSIVTSAADNWEYDFGLVQKYDTEGNEYIYSVVEEPVSGYTAHYTSDKATNGLALMFNSRTGTYNSYDRFTIYYNYRGKIFGKTFYGKSTNSPAGQTINIPTGEFWIAFETDGSNNDYGFKFDQIVPVAMDDSQPVFSRYNPEEWMLEATAEEYEGSRYPETDHDYFVYEKVLMHYTRDMEGDVLDIVNSKDSTGFDIELDKISERGEKLGGVVMQLTSDSEVGDAVIDPIEWTTVANESKVVRLEPGHYVLHEETAIANYQYADDIKFLVNENGKVIIDDEEYDKVEMVDLDAVNKYPFRKVWMDAGYESSRPERIKFELVRDSDGEVVAEKYLTAEDATSDTVWEGWFDDVPIIDDEWNKIDYTVREVSDGSYKVMYEVENMTGFYVTFSENSSLGQNGQLRVYLYDENDAHYYGNYFNKTLILNPEYNMEYLEDRDIAGRTIYIPVNSTGPKGFRLLWSGVSTYNTEEQPEIVSIVPTKDVVDYTTNTWTYSSNLSSNIISDGTLPVINTTSGSVTYKWNPSSTTDFEGSEIINYVNQTSIDFKKRWEDEDFEDSRPETIECSVYNVNDMDTAIQTKTFMVSADNDATYTFDNLPLYNDDWTVAHYVVKETAVNDYVTSYYPTTEKPKGYIIHFSSECYGPNSTLNTYGFTDAAYGTNYFIIDGYDNSWRSSFTNLNTLAGKTMYLVSSNSANPGFIFQVSNNSAEEFYLKIDSIIPIDKEINSTYANYSVSQSNLYNLSGRTFSGYNYPEGGKETVNGNYYNAYFKYDYVAGNYIINTVDKTKIPIKKIWEDTGFESDRPESITLNAYNELDLDTIVGSIELSNSDATSDYVWEGWIDNLPRYNDDGTTANYVIKEVTPSGYFANYGVPKGFWVTFDEETLSTGGYIMLYTYNKKANTTDRYIYYKSNQQGSSVSSIYIETMLMHGYRFFIPIDDASDCSFVIYKNSNSTIVKIKSIELAFETSNAVVSYSSSMNSLYSAQRYSGYKDIVLSDISGYHVIDYSLLDGYFSEGVSGTHNNTITNKVDKTNLEFEKRWEGDDGYTDYRPDSIIFQAFNERYPDTVVQEITVNRSDVENGNKWNCSFTDLPKYNSDGTQIVWKVKEKVVPENYDCTKYGVQNITGFLITFSDDSTLNKTKIQNQGDSLYIYWKRQNDNYYNYYYLSPYSTSYYSFYEYYPESSTSTRLLSGKTIYVPVSSKYEILFGLYKYTNSHEADITIESVIPIYSTSNTVPYNYNTYSSSTSFNPNLNLSLESGTRIYWPAYSVLQGANNTSTSGTQYISLKYDADASFAGLVNTLKKFPVTINKWSNNYECLPGAVLQLKKESGELIEEWETGQSNKKFELPAGTYILHEKTPSVGFASADDITFVVDSEGNITIDGEAVTSVRMFDKELVKVEGQKTWSGDDASSRPESITINLLRNNVVVDSKTVTAANNWKYSWEDLDRYDGQTKNEYIYTVSENSVLNYQESPERPTIYNSWASNLTGEATILRFADNSITESISWDYLYIYFKQDGVMKYYNQKFGGRPPTLNTNGSSDNSTTWLSGREIYIPSTDIYLVWRTDSSATYYGWDVVEARPAALTESTPFTVYTSNLPTSENGYSYQMVECSLDNLPHTNHSTYGAYVTGTSSNNGYGYANNEHYIYHLSAPASIPDVDDRYGSHIVANITNTKLPDKINVSVYKKNSADNSNVAGATLKITGHEDNASYDITPIEWTTTANGPNVVQLRQGSYTLHEVTVPSGYIRADDINFIINSENQIIVNGEVVEAIEMLDVPNVKSIPVKKSWDDSVDSPIWSSDELSQYRPTRITYDLYNVRDMEHPVDSITLSASDATNSNTWESVFENVPVVNEDDESEAVYVVAERDVQYYTKAYSGTYSTLVGNDIGSVRWTPNSGIKIYFGANSNLSGPANIIWRDRITNEWYVGTLSSSDITRGYVAVASKEVYLTMKNASDSPSNGLEITKVEPVNNAAFTFWGGQRAEADLTMNGLYSYINTSISSSLMQSCSGVDLNSYNWIYGNNGYYAPNSLKKNDFQGIKLTVDGASEVVSTGATKEELNANPNVKIIFGDDALFYGATYIAWKDAETGAICYKSLSSTPAPLVVPKAAEYVFYFCDAASGSDESRANAGIRCIGITIKNIVATSEEATSYTTDTNGWTTIAQAYNTMNINGNPYKDPVDVTHGYSGTQKTNNSHYQMLKITIPVVNMQEVEVSSASPANHATTVTNTFDVHTFEVPFNKVDVNGNKIGGAHLKLYKGDTFISEWDTVTGQTHTESLYYGEYTLKETGLPAGYVQANDISFTVTPIGEILIGTTEVQSINMLDNDIVIKIKKVDRDGNIIAGAHLQLLSEDKQTVVKDWTSTTSLVTFKNIPEGVYYIHEVKAPNGYSLEKTDVRIVVTNTSDAQIFSTENNLQLPVPTGRKLDFSIYLFLLLLCGIAFVTLFGKKKIKIK